MASRSPAYLFALPGLGSASGGRPPGFYASADRIAVVVLVVLAALLPVLGASSYVLHVAVVFCVFGILAASWDIVSGTTGQLSFGHAAFFGVGAYSSALLALRFGVSPWLGLLAAGLLAAALGFVVGLPSLRLSGRYLALTTLAFAETLRILADTWVDVTRGSRGLINYPALPGVPADRRAYLYVGLALLVVSVGIMQWLADARFGLVLRAIRDDELRAQAQGVDTRRYKVGVFMISSFFAGVAGAFYAHYILVLTPDVFGALFTANVIAMAALGGLGTTAGAVVGAFAIHVGGEALRGFGAVLHLVLTGGAIVAVILFFPGGLFGNGRGQRLSNWVFRRLRGHRRQPAPYDAAGDASQPEDRAADVGAGDG